MVSLNCIPTLFPGKITLECKLLFEVSHISPPAEDYAALRNSSRITDVAAENLRPLSRPLFLIPSTFSLSEALTGCVSKGICNFTGANLIWKWKSSLFDSLFGSVWDLFFRRRHAALLERTSPSVSRAPLKTRSRARAGVCAPKLRAHASLSSRLRQLTLISSYQRILISSAAHCVAAQPNYSPVTP